MATYVAIKASRAAEWRPNARTNTMKGTMEQKESK
jgi:hypothetical protein